MNDLTNDPTPTPEAAATTTARTMRRSRLDLASNTVTIQANDGSAETTFRLAQMPQASLEYLTLFGLASHLLKADDMQAAFALLFSGKVPETKGKSAPKLSKAREAIAHALAHSKAKANALPGTKAAVVKSAGEALLPEMRTFAAALTKEKARELENTPDVQEHYQRLFGAKPTGVSLLDLAGLSGPVAVVAEAAE